MRIQILLVEDDFYLRDGLCELLKNQAYDVHSAENCQQAQKLFYTEAFDLVILDVMLPDGSGLNLCTELRAAGSDVPILFLTACDEEYQIVRGLDAGGDDYVTKPFKMQELLSRIRALLRRKSSTVLNQDEMQIDIATMSVKKGGTALPLTPTEFQILTFLVSNKGVIVTRSSLLSRIWDCDGNYIDDNTLSVHISRLREKIGTEHLKTIRGVGYRWE